MKNIIVFDIGASKTRIGISHNGRTLKKIEVFATDQSYRRGIQELILAGQRLGGRGRITTAVGGFAGPLNKNKTSAIDCQSKDWIGQPLVRHLSQGWATRVRLENDAALNGLGEALYGAGRGKAIVGFLTLSTGVNGVRVVDGQIDRTARGYELAWLVVPGERGNVDWLEHSIAGRWLARRFGRPPEHLHQRQVWAMVEKRLAFAVTNLMVTWSPDVMVLGGSLMKSIRVSAVRREAKRLWRMPLPMPRLVRGQLGDTSGLYGALALARKTKR